MTVSAPDKAIIFDMDGVLFMSNSCHEQAYLDVLRAEGIGTFDYSEISGMRTDEALEKLFKKFNRELPASERDRLCAAKRARAREILKLSPPVVPVCRQVLEQLALNHRLALASSASSGSVEIFLNASGCRPLFQSILSGEDVAKAKPDPEIYCLAAKRLSLESSACTVIEDAVNGVEAAVRAGMKVVGIAAGAAAEELKRAGAAVVIPALSDLLKIEL